MWKIENHQIFWIGGDRRLLQMYARKNNYEFVNTYFSQLITFKM